MEKLTFETAKHAHWRENYSFDSCKLNRQGYGYFIADYITNEYDGFVLNLNGPWGTGKSHFMRRLYTSLLSRRHPVIYIDAWESDFSKDPLTVVTSELLSQLMLMNDSIGQHTGTLKQLFGKALKGTIYGSAGFITHKLLGDASIGIEPVKALLEEPSHEEFLDQLTSNYQGQVAAIEEIRKQLSALAETLRANYSAELPVVVLIDELDRCRPNYAVEMLEVVKHFFNTPNLVFVIASDTEQLTHSISMLYGDSFDSKRYLKRFFDREARLPIPNKAQYIQALQLDTGRYFNSLTLAPVHLDENSYLPYLTCIIDSFNLEIRDINQVLAKLYSCLRSVQGIQNKTGIEQFIDFPMLLIAIIEQHLGISSYTGRSNTNKKPTDYHKSGKIDADLDIRLISTLSAEFCSIYTRNNLQDRMNQSDLKHHYGTGSSLTRTQYIDGYLKSIIHRNNSAGKTWLWSDYKNLVEMAATLE